MFCRASLTARPVAEKAAHVSLLSKWQQTQHYTLACAALIGLAKTMHTYVYTVYIRYFKPGNHWEITIHTAIYGVHIRYTVLANSGQQRQFSLCYR